MKTLLDERIKELRSLVEQEQDAMPDRGLQFINAFERNVRRLQEEGEIEDIDADEDPIEHLIDQAVAIEAEFENTHPQFSASMRAIVKTLSDMGI